jgi:endonuclease III
MKEPDEIERLIDEISFRKSKSKNYKKMKAADISKELRDIMKFEQESFKKIEEFEKTQQNPDLVQYAKMICKNTTGREIAELQETYLKKIDEEYLNSK